MFRVLPCAALAICVSADAASFNCAKAATPQDKAICASPDLSVADDRLAAAYKTSLAATPPELADLVRKDQRDWLKLIPLYCPDPVPAESQPMPDCLKQIYKARTNALLHLVLHRGGVTFVNRTITRTAHKEDETAPATQNMPGYGTLSASWPIAASHAPEWQAWNKAVKLAALQILVPSEGSPAHDSSADWSAEQDEDNTIEVRIGLVSSGLVTAFVDAWWWRGAHPTESSIQLNWLLNDHRELHASDVFLSGSGWEAALQRRCNRFLHRTLDPEEGGNYETYETNGQMPKSLRQIIDHPRNWQLDHRGLSIVFQDYAVAPRSAHPEPLFIPWSELKPYLNPAFPLPPG